MKSQQVAVWAMAVAAALFLLMGALGIVLAQAVTPAAVAAIAAGAALALIAGLIAVKRK